MVDCKMLGGERVTVDVGTFQNDMANIKRRDDVLTLLIHLGYLAYDTEKKETFIPNEEVKQEFIRAITAGRHTEIFHLPRLIQATMPPVSSRSDDGGAPKNVKRRN